MLQLTGVSRRFGEVVAVDDLDLCVARGEIRGFVGRNGAGKTTAMRIVMGVERPDAGMVRWDDQPADALARRRFGYMPEERGLYPKMPAARQLTYFGRLHGYDRRAAREAARSWLARLGLSDRLGDSVEELSLGNQQRVQLAAALVHDPELLVLDEPFSGLDPVGVDELSAVLRERATAGCAVVFSSHQLELVERLCHSVTIIDAGRSMADGTVEELRRVGDSLVLRVGVAGHDGWLARLPEATVLDRDARGVRIAVRADDGLETRRRVLEAARGVGVITHFAEERPTLVERYRQLIDAEQAP